MEGKKAEGRGGRQEHREKERRKRMDPNESGKSKSLHAVLAFRFVFAYTRSLLFVVLLLVCTDALPVFLYVEKEKEGKRETLDFEGR